MKNMKQYIIPTLAVLLIITGVILIFYFASDNSFNDGSGVIDPGLASDYGSLIGGLVGALFSLAGLLLIFANLIAQKKSFDRQQFENKYFELIRYHRDNVWRIEVDNSKNDKLTGYKAFVYFKENIEQILSIIKELSINKTLKGEELKRAQISIAYMFFFYGFGEKSLEDIKTALKNIHKPIYDNISALDQIFDICKDDITLQKEFSTDGHQELLGHYFRHLYNSFMYLKKSPYLNSKEKYEYGKILRSQLSTFEQAIIFYNSLSPIGNNWVENKIINDFQIIKNIPQHFLDDINPKDYFGDVKFEWEG